MARRRALRWTLGVAATLLALAAALYLLRWPLLGGLVRAEISRLLAAELDGDLAEARFSGSLLFGAAADGVLLRGRPGAPYRELSARRVEASWGFLGSGAVEIRVEGARGAFVSDPAAPPGGELRTIRDIETFFRNFRPPGPLRVADVRLVLADGTKIDVERADFDGSRWTARGRIDGFGAVEISARRELGGPLELAGTASEGPLRSVRLDRARVVDGAARARASVRVLERDVEAEADVRYDAADFLRSAEGTVKGIDGEGKFSVDFAGGTMQVDGGGSIDVREPVEASVRWSARGSGPILGPFSAWSASSGRLHAERLAWRGRAFEDVKVEVLRATASEIEWKALARRGPDFANADGTLVIGAPASATGRIHAVILEPSAWIDGLRAEGLRVEGRFAVGADARFDGRVRAGPGAWSGVAWSSLDAALAAGPDGVEAPDVRVAGLPGAPDLAATVSADRRAGGAWALRVDARSGSDAASFDGTIGPGDAIAGTFSARGTFAAAGLPEPLAPLDLRGSIDAKDGIARVRTGPGGSRVKHGPLDAAVSAGRAELAAVDVELPEASLTARLGGTLAWTPERVDVKAKAEGLRWRERELGEAGADFSVDRASAEARGALSWTSGRGDEARAEGRWGREADVRVTGRAALSTFGPAELKGTAEADLRVSGPAGALRAEGRVSASEARWGDLLPSSVAASLRTDAGRLLARIEPTDTPYGRLSADGAWPLDGKGAVEARARIETVDLAPAAPFLPEGLRPWIPPAKAEVHAEVAGAPGALRWRAGAWLRADELRLPAPLAPVRGLELKATASSDGPLRVESLRGRLGGGAFLASGNWTPEAPGRPFRLSFEGHELLVVTRPLSHIRVSVDADLTWSSTSGARLEGLVVVPLALIHEEPSLSGGGSTDPRHALSVGGLRLRPAPGGGVLLPGIPELKGLAIDLKVLSTGELRVENSVVGARLAVDGQIRGTAAEPSAYGSVRATRGEVKLPGAIFVRIASARAVVPPRPGAEPFVHFEGRVGVGEGAVEIVVDGPLAQPSLDLRSDPPRPREQLLAELAFGHGTGAVAGDAALGALAFRVFDQFAAGWPSADPSDGFFQRLRPTVVTEQDETLRPPWELPSSRPARGTVVRTEYILTPWFSVVGEADGEANVGGDLKLRLRFR